MSAPHPLPRSSSRLLRPQQTRADVTANRETAVKLLSSCVEAKLTCLEEIMRYIGENAPRTKRLLEDVLKLEERHAEELIGVLQVHRAVSSIRIGDNPVASLTG